jgi:hypothetical protein
MNICLGLSDTLDNEKSVQWKTTTAAAGTAQIGVGLCNNKAFDAALGSTEQQLLQKQNQEYFYIFSKGFGGVSLTN